MGWSWESLPEPVGNVYVAMDMIGRVCMGGGGGAVAEVDGAHKVDGTHLASEGHTVPFPAYSGEFSAETRELWGVQV